MSAYLVSKNKVPVVVPIIACGNAVIKLSLLLVPEVLKCYRRRQ